MKIRVSVVVATHETKHGADSYVRPLRKNEVIDDVIKAIQKECDYDEDNEYFNYGVEKIILDTDDFEVVVNLLKDKRKVKFSSPQEMLECIQIGYDLYNLETGDYIWCYNDCGSIAVDNFSIEEAEKLEQEAVRTYTYWAGLIGGGSTIYDDPSSEHWEDGQETNLNYCEEVYNKGTWIDVTH